MSNYGWTNEAGEPIMDGAAYRFEQQLDADYADQRFLDDDDFFGGDDPTCDDVDPDDVNEAGLMWCYGCDEYADHAAVGDIEPHVPEDAWLDGSYEE